MDISSPSPDSSKKRSRHVPVRRDPIESRILPTGEREEDGKRLEIIRIMENKETKLEMLESFCVELMETKKLTEGQLRKWKEGETENKQERMAGMETRNKEKK